MVQKAVVCPHCKQIIGSEEKVCSWCGAPRRFGLSRIIASTFSAVDLPIKGILSVTIIMYGLSLLLSISGGEGLLSPGDHALLQLGATGTYPLAMYGRYDSLITAIYLHGGLLHLLFNMMALTQLGPLVSQVFGSSRMFSIYTLSGIIGFIGLVVPHLVRLALGNDQRVLIPAAARAGGTLLTLADTAARTVMAPQQLPVGVLTALIGVPVFLFLLSRSPRSAR